MTPIGLALMLAAPAWAGSVSFTNIAEDPAMNLEFERVRSAGYADLLAFYNDSVTTPVILDAPFMQPHRTGGFPGVGLIDHDGDGDTDIYVTNGPGAANGLFSNQLMETGSLSFVDLSASSGADATDLDSNGVCFGDLDNDGDDDLFVLGRETGNRLFENQGGTFVQVMAHGAEGGDLSHVSCSMGDIDADGYLDIVVANVFDLSTLLALVAVPYDFNHPNQLFHNDGGMTFSDVSATSGILSMDLGGTVDPEPPTISWAVSMVDIDLDGDIDIVVGDDQAVLPTEVQGGFDRGYLQTFLNDGTGNFTNDPLDISDISSGAWMSLSFGDLDCNQSIDMFTSNFGDYMAEGNGFSYVLGDLSTRWILNNNDGTYDDPNTGGVATAFGWGNAISDLDNDGDPDLLYHGAMDVNLQITHDNPGIVLENQGCSASFEENLTAFRGDYLTRGTQGVATGDLDRDGYVDVVTVSNHTIDPGHPFALSPSAYGSDLDATGGHNVMMAPDAVTGLFSWVGLETSPGTMTVELNDGSGNHAVTFVPVGSVGLTDDGQVNRSGIGAVVGFTPLWGDGVIDPITAGSSFLSQHAREAHFGMGQSLWGTAEIMWPGGVRNKLYYVFPGENLVLPEIPCDMDELGLLSYGWCVGESLYDLETSGTISTLHAVRLGGSAIIAYFD